jgi:hypothetical protein
MDQQTDRPVDVSGGLRDPERLYALGARHPSLLARTRVWCNASSKRLALPMISSATSHCTFGSRTLRTLLPIGRTSRRPGADLEAIRSTSWKQ